MVAAILNRRYCYSVNTIIPFHLPLRLPPGLPLVSTQILHKGGYTKFRKSRPYVTLFNPIPTGMQVSGLVNRGRFLPGIHIPG